MGGQRKDKINQQWKMSNNVILSGLPAVLFQDSHQNIVAVDPFVPNDEYKSWDTLSITNCCSAPKDEEPEFKHGGMNCWEGCDKIRGKCDWCGTEGYCCKKGVNGNGCDGSFDYGGPYEWQTICVQKPKPVEGLENAGLDCW